MKKQLLFVLSGIFALVFAGCNCCCAGDAAVPAEKKDAPACCCPACRSMWQKMKDCFSFKKCCKKRHAVHPAKMHGNCPKCGTPVDFLIIETFDVSDAVPAPGADAKTPPKADVKTEKK